MREVVIRYATECPNLELSEYRPMTNLKRQRSCSLCHGAVPIASEGSNEHVASVPKLYFISYYSISYFIIS